MQFKKEGDELFIDTPIVNKTNLRGIHNKTLKHDDTYNHDLNLDGNTQKVSLIENDSEVTTSKSLGSDRKLVEYVPAPYVYNPRDQYKRIRSIRGQRNGFTRSFKRNYKPHEYVLDPINVFTLDDGKFIQTNPNTLQFNNTYGLGAHRNNFLEYNLIAEDLVDESSGDSNDSYIDDNTINKFEHIKLPIYITAFGIGFVLVILLFWGISYIKSLIFKSKRFKKNGAKDLDDADSIQSIKLNDGMCLAESRANNPGLMNIDFYISASTNLGSEFSDTEVSDLNDDGYEDDDSPNAIVDNMRNVFNKEEDDGVNVDESNFDEETQRTQLDDAVVYSNYTSRTDVSVVPIERYEGNDPFS